MDSTLTPPRPSGSTENPTSAASTGWLSAAGTLVAAGPVAGVRPATASRPNPHSTAPVKVVFFIAICFPPTGHARLADPGFHTFARGPDHDSSASSIGRD